MRREYVDITHLLTSHPGREGFKVVAGSKPPIVARRRNNALLPKREDLEDLMEPSLRTSFPAFGGGRSRILFITITRSCRSRFRPARPGRAHASTQPAPLGLGFNSSLWRAFHGLLDWSAASAQMAVTILDRFPGSSWRRKLRPSRPSARCPGSVDRVLNRVRRP
jgi:hypothetical protein